MGGGRFTQSFANETETPAPENEVQVFIFNLIIMIQEMNLKLWEVTPMSTLEMQEVNGGFLKGLGTAVKAVGHAIGVAAKWAAHHLKEIGQVVSIGAGIVTIANNT